MSLKENLKYVKEQFKKHQDLLLTQIFIYFVSLLASLIAGLFLGYGILFILLMIVLSSFSLSLTNLNLLIIKGKEVELKDLHFGFKNITSSVKLKLICYLKNIIIFLVMVMSILVFLLSFMFLIFNPSLLEIQMSQAELIEYMISSPVFENIYFFVLISVLISYVIYTLTKGSKSLVPYLMLEKKLNYEHSINIINYHLKKANVNILKYNLFYALYIIISLIIGIVAYALLYLLTPLAIQTIVIIVLFIICLIASLQIPVKYLSLGYLYKKYLSEFVNSSFS